jgi:endonuclease G
MMVKTRFLKSTKVNVVLIIVGVVFLHISTPNRSIFHPLSETEVGYPNIDKIEIPAKLTERQEQIISHIGYTVSYNSEWKIPNWVAYELTKEEVDGTVSRSDVFTLDPAISPTMSASSYDYQYSGWDKGHMAPAGDMKWSEQAMKESFYLSNICPQNQRLNGGLWKDLETHVRNIAVQKGHIYVVCGPIVSKHPRTIGQNKVVVPDAFFKVLLQNDNGIWNTIAFMFANENERLPLSTYAMSVEDMQVIADFDFFPTLLDSIEKKIESLFDLAEWNINVIK